jgi:hypothetical protein
MSDVGGVSFNEEPDLVPHRVLPPEKPKFSLVGIVMNMGMAKTEQGANTALACLAVVMIIAAAGTYLFSTVPKNGIPAAEAAAELHSMHAQGH